MSTLFALLQRLLPHHLLSRLVGIVAGSRIPVIKNTAIRLFCRAYDINVAEAISTQFEDYPTFNSFFTRELRPGLRPISGNVCCPADGTVAQVGRIDGTTMLQAKGKQFLLTDLLGRSDCGKLTGGSFATIYLAPHDYHRVHMPIRGKLLSTRYIPGRLFSVNQATSENIDNLFAINERLVMNFTTERGPMAVVMVGAMIVAGIRPAWRDDVYPPGQVLAETHDGALTFDQGDELGWFQMGSTVIVVLPGNAEWQCRPGDVVRMGQALI